MTKHELHLRLIECAKGVLDENAEHPGAFVAGSVNTDKQNNGVVLSGDGGDIVILLAQMVDKIAIKSGQPYKRVLRDMRDILRFFERDRRKAKPGEVLFSEHRVELFNDQDDTDK